MEEKLIDSKGNSAALYNFIHEFIDQNPIYTQDIVGVLETVKLEFVIEAINEVDEEEE